MRTSREHQQAVHPWICFGLATGTAVGWV